LASAVVCKQVISLLGKLREGLPALCKQVIGLLGEIREGQPALCEQFIDLLFVSRSNDLLFASRIVAFLESSEQAGLLAYPESSQHAACYLRAGH
jgi:hypothetical protein